MTRMATAADVPRIAAMMCALWPHHDLDEMVTECHAFLQDEAVALIVWEENGEAMGFAQCSLRCDYVEGTETSPVGYLEAVYVAPEKRRQGAARQLVAACENWAREQDCREFASDCELHNTDSLRFHLANGFQEANRIICFVKELK